VIRHETECANSKKKLIGEDARKKSDNAYATARPIRHETECADSKKKLIGEDVRKKSDNELGNMEADGDNQPVPVLTMVASQT